MATIKTQGGKIITNGGRVSCECCGLCCFYPAQGLFDGKYSIDDLPNQIEVIFQGLGSGIDGTYLLSKNNPPSADYRGFPVYYGSAESTFIYLNTILLNGILRATWFFAGQAGLVETDFDCIVLPADFNNDSQSRDEFAESYSVTGPVGPDNQVVTEIVVRGPLTGPDIAGRLYYNCTWKSKNFNLRYNGRIKKDSPFTVSGSFKWAVNGNPKTGFQNDPVGDYEGGFSVE
jgi:hypothetical protein